MKMFLKKSGYTLLPVYRSDIDSFAKIENNQVVECDVTQPRNLKLHKLFFAMLNAAFENWRENSTYKSIDEFLIALKFEVGFVKRAYMFNGKIITIPKSISFKETDNIEFKEFFDRCLDCLSKHLGIHVMDLLKEAEEK